MTEEGDNWFIRNKKKSLSEDKKKLIDYYLPFIGDKNKVLEIGCSDGINLNYLNQQLPHRNLDLNGIDPSRKSIELGNKNYQNINLSVGTADNLEYDEALFDVVICGFFLYLIDRNLIFKIVSEIDRVIKEGGYLIIVDFEVPFPSSNDYVHFEGIKSYKNNYSKFFTGGGHYTLIGKKHYSHQNVDLFERNIDERVSTSILYKEFLKDLYL